MVATPDSAPFAATAGGIAGHWRQLCADFVAIWGQVLNEANGAPPARAGAVYAAGAQRLGLLLASAPATAAAPGGWLDVALRACAAASPPEAAEAVAALVRALTRCQAALAAFAGTERAVLLRGCAAFGQRVAGLAAQDRGLRTHLRLWIEAIDEAHAAATRDPRYVREHAAVINALFDVTIALRAAGQQYVRAFDLPVRAEMHQLESRIVELERRLADVGVTPAAPATKVRVKAKPTVKPTPKTSSAAAGKAVKLTASRPRRVRR